MNKQHLYTFGGALLATTALSSAANALTVGRWASTGAAGGEIAFATSGLTIANTIFSPTASTANGVVITPSVARAFGARFSNVYNSNTALNTAFSIEMVPSGAEFTNGTALLANVDLLVSLGTAAGTAISSIGAEVACSAAIGFGTTFVINGCTAAAGTVGANGGAGANASINIVGVMFSGVTFTNASGLATVGNTVQLTGRVYNTATSGVFEQASTGTILTAGAPVTVSVTNPGNVTASATSTPTAFSALTATNAGQTTNTMDLINIMVTGTGALLANLGTVADPDNSLSSISVTVASAAFSGGATVVQITSPGAGATTINTVTAFSGGTVTFHLHDVDYGAANTASVRISWNGTSVIPEVAAGTATAVAASEALDLVVATVTGATASISQGGFRAEINTFNSSGNGPFGSYLRIHNNGAVAGGVNITVRNDDHASGATLGSVFTTAAIQPGATMQLSAAEIEDTATSTKLPAGGANIPAASRVGSYTLRISGPIVGYVQHILFDGNSVADLSSFRNSGQSASAP